MPQTRSQKRKILSAETTPLESEQIFTKRRKTTKNQTNKLESQTNQDARKIDRTANEKKDVSRKTGKEKAKDVTNRCEPGASEQIALKWPWQTPTQNEKCQEMMKELPTLDDGTSVMYNIHENGSLTEYYYLQLETLSQNLDLVALSVLMEFWMNIDTKVLSKFAKTLAQWTQTYQQEDMNDQHRSWIAWILMQIDQEANKSAILDLVKDNGFGLAKHIALLFDETSSTEDFRNIKCSATLQSGLVTDRSQLVKTQRLACLEIALESSRDDREEIIHELLAKKNPFVLVHHIAMLMTKGQEEKDEGQRLRKFLHPVTVVNLIPDCVACCEDEDVEEYWQKVFDAASRMLKTNLKVLEKCLMTMMK